MTPTWNPLRRAGCWPIFPARWTPARCSTALPRTMSRTTAQSRCCPAGLPSRSWRARPAAWTALRRWTTCWPSSKKYPARPAGASSDPLPDNERYALGFSGLYEVAQFALQTSQPALLTETGLDEARFAGAAFLHCRRRRSLRPGNQRGSAMFPTALSSAATRQTRSPGRTGMSDYGQFGRARFGWDSIATPRLAAGHRAERQGGRPGHLAAGALRRRPTPRAAWPPSTPAAAEADARARFCGDAFV